VLMPPDAAPRLLQAPSAAHAAAKVTLDVVDYDEQGRIRFAGTGQADSIVMLYVDGAPAGGARVDAQGRWWLAPRLAVTPGEHRLRVDQIGKAGNVAARVELPFERAQLATQDVPLNRVVVQPQQSLWRIARRTYGRGVEYTVIYQANRSQIRDPNLIYPGQVFAIPKLAGTATGSTAQSGSASTSR